MGQKIYTKEDIWNLPTCIAVRKISLLPTLTPSQRLEKKNLAMEILSWDPLYVNTMCAKFQVQKICPPKDIWNLPTCVVVRKFSLHMLVDFKYLFLCKSFGPYVINIEMILWKKFHGKKTIFQPLRGHQSWE